MSPPPKRRAPIVAHWNCRSFLRSGGSERPRALLVWSETSSLRQASGPAAARPGY